MIYEFNATTLQTSGDPFEGHTEIVTGLALSFDGALLASASNDNTIKLWAFESRQLLTSFSVQNPFCLVFSPDSRQLAYTTHTEKKNDNNIFICNTPISAHMKSGPGDLLKSDATHRLAATRRNPSTLPVIARPPRSLPAVDLRQPILLRIRKLLRLGLPVQNGQPLDPLDFPATLPLPPNLWHSSVDSRENVSLCSCNHFSTHTVLVSSYTSIARHPILFRRLHYLHSTPKSPSCCPVSAICH
ncbi:hypothetical protein EV424DRAFT_291694 [Suillus variegatus]|nr:hypothetical protein EV424DRAFT_291694 [Suillus variegatus]